MEFCLYVESCLLYINLHIYFFMVTDIHLHLILFCFIIIDLCMLGNFLCYYCHLLTFEKINLLKKFF